MSDLTTDLVRTARDGCWQVRSNAWGQFLAPCDDPDANAELTDESLDAFELHTGLDKIPADLWSRWIQLCLHFGEAKQGDLEVSCLLLRSEFDKSIWRILVPVQEVSGASVRVDSFDMSIDITTGEVVEQYPPAGWIPAGTSHSHNSMPLARFSSVDDANELGNPGLHIVISHVDVNKRTYVPTASVTANKRRFYLPDCSEVVDLTPMGESFHESVLDIIDAYKPKPLATAPLWKRTALYGDPDCIDYTGYTGGWDYSRNGAAKSTYQGYSNAQTVKPLFSGIDADSWLLTCDSDEIVKELQDVANRLITHNEIGRLNELHQELLEIAEEIQLYTHEPTQTDDGLPSSSTDGLGGMASFRS